MPPGSLWNKIQAQAPLGHPVTPPRLSGHSSEPQQCSEIAVVTIYIIRTTVMAHAS